MESVHLSFSLKKHFWRSVNVEKPLASFSGFFQIPVLFEETFFNANDESYMVLCITQPLDGATSGL